jgi:hypothetical protein
MQHRGTRQRTARSAHGAWPLTLALVACSAEAVDLGDGRLESGRSPLESSGIVWDGYAELYQFTSGSDRLRLTLDGLGGGRMAFGEGTERPAPPVDADHAFDFGREEYQALPPDLSNGTRYFVDGPTWEGLPYPVIHVLVDLARVDFEAEALVLDPRAANREREALAQRTMVIVAQRAEVEGMTLVDRRRGRRALADREPPVAGGVELEQHAIGARRQLVRLEVAFPERRVRREGVAVAVATSPWSPLARRSRPGSWRMPSAVTIGSRASPGTRSCSRARTICGGCRRAAGAPSA